MLVEGEKENEKKNRGGRGKKETDKFSRVLMNKVTGKTNKPAARSRSESDQTATLTSSNSGWNLSTGTYV